MGFSTVVSAESPASAPSSISLLVVLARVVGHMGPEAQLVLSGSCSVEPTRLAFSTHMNVVLLLPKLRRDATVDHGAGHLAWSTQIV